MNKVQTLLTTSVMALMSSMGLAHATMIDVVLGNTASDISYSTGSNVLTPNINLATEGSNLVFNNNSQLISPPTTIINQYIQPSGTLFGNTYLAVSGIPTTGLATFKLSPGDNAFAFTWGTLDAYNTLKIADSRGVVYSITGSDILNLIAGSIAGTTQSDVTITSSFGTFLTAQLSSTNNSFEAANFSSRDPLGGATATPLPPALPLFGAALIGITFMMRRKIS